MPEMPDIFAAAEQHRRALLERERRAASEMVRAYGVAWQRIKRQLDDLGRQIEQARARGEDVSASWLLQRERLQTLQRQVEAEIREVARLTEQRIIAEQAEAVRAAQDHAEQLVLAGLGEPPPGVTVTFARLPTQALSDLVGVLQDGSPLRSLLDELGPEASTAVRDALVAGVATGQNPRTIARQVRQALGGNLARALRIARTEVLRSYREASRRTYQNNSDIVKGWIWHSATNARTCPACWALHGTFHRLDERLDDHPNGRCAMVPLTKTWKELGFEDVPETRVQVERGTDLFERLSDDQQRRILGQAAFRAYQAGTVTLEDFVGRRVSREWGTMRYARSVRGALEAAGRRVAAQPKRKVNWQQRSAGGYEWAEQGTTRSLRFVTRADDLSPDEFDADDAHAIITGVHDHVRGILTQHPRWVQMMDEDGEYMLQGKDRRISINIVFTAREADAGMGSAGPGSSRVFWAPYDAARRPRERMFQLDPVYTLTHELHHAVGSATKFDAISDFMALDFHLANGNRWNAELVKEEIVSKTGWAMSRSRKNTKDLVETSRLGMSWLYRRHPEMIEDIVKEQFGGRDAARADAVISKLRSW